MLSGTSGGTTRKKLPEEHELEVFMHLADDEEDDWECRGGTIRASQPLDQSLAMAATCGDS